jgi:hypothetical protein
MSGATIILRILGYSCGGFYINGLLKFLPRFSEAFGFYQTHASSVDYTRILVLMYMIIGSIYIFEIAPPI